MNWYYVENGQQAGPVDDAGLSALVSSGKIQGDTLVWREGMANWQPYQELVAPQTQAPAQTQPTGVATGTRLRINRDPAPEQAAQAAQGAGEEAVCAECGGIFPVSETIRIGEARVCAKCKPVFMQRMREGINVGGATSFRYAGFWIRFAAKFIDGLLVGVVIFVPLMLIGFFVALGASHNTSTNFVAPNAAAVPQAGAQFVANAVGLFAQVVYVAFNAVLSCVFLGKWGATPGKMACGLKVVQADGSKVGYGRGFGRGCAELVSRLICSIGYIMAAFDSEKRALHDRMCNTRVIYK